MNLRQTFVFACVVAASAALNAADWPQWMGPGRDGIWTETGVVRSIPEEGLPVKWRLPISGGYAGPAVANGQVYVCDYVAETGDVQFNSGVADVRSGKERVLCVDGKTGQIIWSHEYDCDYEVSYGNGPRVTPTVDADRVYTIGAMGHLFCFNAADGEILWQRQIIDDYNTKAPYWGVSAHPLVDGDKLICLVGGEGSAVVAFDKKTGQELWKSLTAADAGYCPPSIIEAGGKRQLIIWLPETINGLNPETGAPYWSQPLKPDYNMSIMMPRK
ncbi:MAG: PQQ-binding-like beta-propeller repeat protein, partial [Maioricimonas sp. JB049]